MKKIVSLLTVLVLTCTTFFSALPTSAEETQSANQPQIENDIFVKGTNSFGNLLSDELTAKMDEQQENNGCNVFSAEVTNKTVLVKFETTKDCTLVAAIYDEAGVQMLASGSAEVTKDETEKTVEVETDNMPQYYIIKVFLIDTYTLKPICSSYESSYYTQEMQEILTLSTDDFDGERVLNLDDDQTNNFAVYSESTITAESTGEINKVLSADEENETYIIENPDSTVAALQNGDILACEQETGEVLIIKVESTETDGTEMTIIGQDTSMEEVFDYIKIDSSKQAGEANYDPSTLSEGLTYEGFSELEQNSMPKYKSTYIGTIEDEGVVPIGAKINVNMAKAGIFSLTGSLSYSAKFSMKLYLSLKRQFIEFKIDNTLKIALTLTGKIEEKINLGSFDMMIFPGVNVGVIPRFVTKASVSFETSGTLTATIGFNYEHAKKENHFNNLSTTPSYKDTMKLEGKLSFGLELEPNVSIISSKLVRLGFTGSAMAEISMSRELYSSEQAIEKDKYHECDVCFSGDIKVNFGLSIDLTFLDSKNLKFSKDLASKNIKITDLYYSVDHNDYNYGTCPWQKFRITLVVLGEDLRPSSGAEIKIDDDKETYMTDIGGVVRFYLPGESTHTITATCDGFSREKNISVKRSSKCVYLWMNENSYHQGGGGRLGNVVKEEPCTTEKPIVNTPMGAVKEVSLGDSYSGAITENGSLYMWGENIYGQLGNGTTEDSSTPIKIMDNVRKVSLGYLHSGAITEDGSLYMWGSNRYGQLGNGTTTASSTPMKIMDNVIAASFGDFHSAAITEDGSLYMWGDNIYGQLGNGECGQDIYSSTPIKIMDNIKSVNLGNNYSGAITEDGSLYMWGENIHGRLGNGTTEDILTPIKIMDNVKELSLGNNHSAAVTEDGSLYMWGDNIYGQLGNKTTEDSLTPVRIMNNVNTVSLGGYHSAAITENGSLYMWGYNDRGQLGNGTIEDSLTPIKIMDNVKAVSLGEWHSSAITKDGSLYMWGWNLKGQLGNGESGYYGETLMDSRYSSIPIKINNASSASPASTFSLTNDISIFADEETNSNLKQSEFKNLLPNEIYNFYIMKTDTEKNLLNGDNLLYIDQYTSDNEGNITASYITKEEYDDAIIFLVRMSAIQLTAENTDITAEDLEATGESQVVRPVVMYNGKELIPGTDYDVEGDFSAVSAGEYTAVIVGKENYVGEVEFTYNIVCEHQWENGVCIKCDQECQHEFVDGVCSICGNLNALKGDANLDGKINIIDAAFIAKKIAQRRKDDLPECADYNEDGICNIIDAAAIAKDIAARKI